MTPDEGLELVRTASAVVDEARAAHAKHSTFASAHEAFGVLAEEVAELLDAIRMQPNDVRPSRDYSREGRPRSRAECIREEAIQCAAVCLRLASQVGGLER